MEAKLIKVDKNGTKYYMSTVCPACNGKGIIPHYYYNEGGRCFACDGSGSKVTKWKEYTAEYQKVLDERRFKKQMKQTPALNEKFLLINNFSEDGKTYAVIGDSYNIKEQIKEDGGKFLRGLGWHFSSNNPKYDCIEIDVKEVTRKDIYERYTLMSWDEIEEVVRAKTPKSEIQSNYICKEGDKVELRLTLKNTFSYEQSSYSSYNETDTIYVYKFEDNDKNIVVWKTQTVPTIDTGKTYIVKGTVKEHKEYKGEKQTVLTRCKITEA